MSENKKTEHLKKSLLFYLTRAEDSTFTHAGYEMACSQAVLGYTGTP